MIDYWCDSKEIARGIADRFNVDRPDFATLRQRLLDAIDAISDDFPREPLDPCTWRRIIRVRIDQRGPSKAGYVDRFEVSLQFVVTGFTSHFPTADEQRAAKKVSAVA